MYWPSTGSWGSGTLNITSAISDWQNMTADNFTFVPTSFKGFAKTFNNLSKSFSGNVGFSLSYNASTGVVSLSNRILAEGYDEAFSCVLNGQIYCIY